MSHSEQFWSNLWSLCGLHWSWWHIANFLSGVVRNYKFGYYSWLYCVLFLMHRYCKGARGNGFKLKEGQFGLDIRKIFGWVVQHWRWLPRKEVDGPSLKILKVRLDGSEQPGGCWRCPCLLQGCWTVWPLKVLSNPYHSLILCLHMIFKCFWI